VRRRRRPFCNGEKKFGHSEMATKKLANLTLATKKMAILQRRQKIWPFYNDAKNLATLEWRQKFEIWLFCDCTQNLATSKTHSQFLIN
jgi:hypothetical protein